MTHYTVSVILPEGAEQLEPEVTRLLEPYYEGAEVFADGSRWDWWVVGGRWDGVMTGDGIETQRECPNCKPEGSDTLVEPNAKCFWCGGSGIVREWHPNELLDTLHRNSCRASEVAPSFVPTAYVDPDGEWHEVSRMGWWGVPIPDENGNEAKAAEDWEAEWRDALAKHPSNIVVLVDCHV